MALNVFDIKEYLAAHGTLSTASTVAQVITQLQTGLSFTCPQCDPVNSGGIPIVDPVGTTVRVTCPLCKGAAKTELEYQAVTGTTGYELVP